MIYARIFKGDVWCDKENDIISNPRGEATDIDFLNEGVETNLYKSLFVDKVTLELTKIYKRKKWTSLWTISVRNRVIYKFLADNNFIPISETFFYRP